MPTMLNSQASALLRLPDGADDRNAVADLPAEPLGQVDADDRALPIASQAFICSGGTLNSG